MLRKLCLTFFAVLMLSAIATTGLADTSKLSEDAKRQLSLLKRDTETLERLENQKLITHQQKEEETNKVLAQASTIAGTQISPEELKSQPDPITYMGGTWDKIKGFFTATKIIFFVAVLLLFVGVCILFPRIISIFLELFVLIPKEFYELLAYGLSITLFFWGKRLDPSVGEYIGLLGLVAACACLAYSVGSRKLDPPEWLSGLALTILSGAGALYYHSNIMGFAAVIALMATVGFTVLVSPFVYAIGFKNEDAVPKGTAAAFILLIAACIIRITNTSIPNAEVFLPGMFWMGSFVGFIGLLIISTRWYLAETDNIYIVHQLIMAAACLLAVFVGSVYGFGELQKIGGTFLFLWLFEKFAEIPAKQKEGFALLAISIGSALLGFWWFVNTHKEVMAKYLIGL